MKVNSQMKRAFVAVLCVVTMLFSSISPLADNIATTQAAEGSYKELTFSDWGMTNGEFVDLKTYDLVDTSITSLDGVAINGMFEVSKDVAFYFGGVNDGWSKTYARIMHDGDSEVIAFAADESVYTGGGKIYVSEIQEKLKDASFTLLNNEFELRLTFDIQEDNSLVVGVYINDTFIRGIAYTGSEALGTKMMVYQVSGVLDDLDLRDVVDGEPVYQELTFKDFGIYPGTLSSDKIGTNDDISSLDEVAVSGKIKFGSGWLMMGHEDTTNTEWSGIQMYAGESGLNVSGALFDQDTLQQLSVSNVSTGGTFSTTEEGYIKVDFNGTFEENGGWCNVDFSTVSATKEIHVFMKNDSDYPRYVQMNWNAASKVIDANGVDITAMVNAEGPTKIPANSGWLEVIYPLTSGQNFNCISRDTADGMTVGSLLIKGYYADAGTRYGFTPSDGQISNEEAGVDFANDYVDLRLTFDYTATGVDMGVYVNDSFIKTISFGDSDDGTRNIKDLLGPCVMATTGLNYMGTYKELTFADFGIPSGFLTSNAIGTSDDITSLDGVAVSGAVKFGSGWLMMGHESAERSDWSGIQMSANADNNNNLNVSGNLFAYPPLSQLSITGTTGSTYSTTEEGYIKVDFNGTSAWCDVNFNAVSATKEIHIFLKNDSDSARLVSLNWKAASKVLDENGNDVTTSIVSNGNTVIPANSGWLEVVYTVTSASQINCTSLSGEAAINSVGSLLIKGYYVDERAAQSYNFPSSESPISTGVDLANDYVNMRYTFDYTETGVNMGVYVNDNFIKTITFGDSTDGVYNIKECLGKYIMATAGMTYMAELPEEDAKTILEEAGYTRVTVTDFVAMSYKTYTATDSHQAGNYTWADTLDKTYLDMNVTFNTSSTNDGYIRYGSSNGWGGVNVSSDGTSLTVGFASGEMTTIIPQQVGLTSFDNVNIKIALDCGTFTSTTDDSGNTYNVADYTLSMWVNNRKVIDELTQTGQTYAGNMLAVYVGAEGAQITLGDVYTDVDRMDVSYELTDASPSYLVTGTAKVLKDGAEFTLSDDCAIREPGDYEVITDVADKSIRYHQKVALYKIGDVDLNGAAGEAGDLTALEAIYTSTPYEANSAAEKAADLDNDGMVDTEDWQLMKQICAATDSAAEMQAVKEKYHPAAKSYDYLDNVANEQDVMPIVGYYGPYDNEGYDFLKDEYFQLVKDSGINLVSYSYNNADGQLDSVIKTLKMAEKHKLGWFVYDESLNSAKTGTTFTDKEFAETLGRYAYYDTFLGILIADEPVYEKSAEATWLGNDNLMSNYTAISERLNKYGNLTGHINLAPEDSKLVNGLANDYFDEYFDQYVTESKPQILSVDDYPFNDDADEGVDNASGYFRSLSKIREQSVDNDIPFWWYVQAGGNFKNTSDSGYSYETEHAATEAETYWNVNTALAFGAKGIQWFTLMQSKGFYDSSQTKQLNGLLDANGNKNEYYNYAVNINAQIANVDEVLMKAESKGVITTGGHAATEVKEGVDANSFTTSPIITVSDTAKLESVTADDTTYGALIGCFDYRSGEAYYVVNYNVEESQTVTLNFKGNYKYRIMDTTTRTVMGDSCTMNIEAGKAVLVVLDSMIADANGNGIESVADLVRYKKMTDSTGTITDTYFAVDYVADMNYDNMITDTDTDYVRKYLIADIDKRVLPISPVEGATVAEASDAAEALITDYYMAKSDTIRTGEDIYHRDVTTLAWMSFEDVTEYTVKVGTQADLSDGIEYTTTGCSLDLMNLLADTDYYWMVTAGEYVSTIQTFHTADTVRSITIEGVSNTRDGGGWPTVDGKTVKQGMYYRGGKLEDITSAGMNVMLNQLNIKTDLDLRNSTETDGSGSPLGDTVNYVVYSGPYYWGEPTGINAEAYREALLNEIQTFANEENYPIYVHCSLGRDRTGSICFLINALLGVDKEDLYLDYEYSFLSVKGNADNQTAEHMVKTAFDTMYNEVQNYASDGTMAEAAEAFMLSIGVTQDEIDSIRAILLEDK